jgi:hypothetical protein
MKQDELENLVKDILEEGRIFLGSERKFYDQGNVGKIAQASVCYGIKIVLLRVAEKDNLKFSVHEFEERYKEILGEYLRKPGKN